MENVSQEAEELINETEGNVSEKVREARARLNAALDRAKETCGEWREKAISGARATDRSIREHPYQSIGVAFALGVLIGALANRRGE
jgi:ElaB/YqjD/DUF883 family membrane-anchored ribosome-binding protein